MTSIEITKKVFSVFFSSLLVIGVLTLFFLLNAFFENINSMSALALLIYIAIYDIILFFVGLIFSFVFSKNTSNKIYFWISTATYWISFLVGLGLLIAGCFDYL
jgi:hypothetical protein